jgi:transposase
MAKPLVSDELWAIVEPLIPKVERRYRFPGRMRIDDRKVLTGILYVLKTGIPWEYLPREMGCGSGMTCWRRLQEWQQAGVWRRLHEVLLAKLHEADRIDWSRAVIDSSHVRAGGRGTPLALSLSAANRTTSLSCCRSSMRFRPCAASAAVLAAGRAGCLATAPTTTAATAASCGLAGISAAIPRPKQRHGSGLGKQRWVVERTIAWLHQYHRLRVRYERRADIHEAFLQIAGCLICLKLLRAQEGSC